MTNRPASSANHPARADETDHAHAPDSPPPPRDMSRARPARATDLRQRRGHAQSTTPGAIFSPVYAGRGHLVPCCGLLPTPRCTPCSGPRRPRGAPIARCPPRSTPLCTTLHHNPASDARLRCSSQMLAAKRRRDAERRPALGAGCHVACRCKSGPVSHQAGAGVRYYETCDMLSEHGPTALAAYPLIRHPCPLYPRFFDCSLVPLSMVPGGSREEHGYLTVRETICPADHPG
jgi:hypothetical protein